MVRGVARRPLDPPRPRPLRRCVLRVAAVAVDGTSGTVLMVDGATGEPIYPPMLYNEKRPDAMPAVEAMAPEGHTVRSATSALCKLHSWWTEQASDSSDGLGLGREGCCITRTGSRFCCTGRWV